MKLRRNRDPEIDPELAATRRALLAVVAEIGARLEAVEVQGRQTQRQLARLPAQTVWTGRYLADASEDTPDLLISMAAEVAAWQHEHPDLYRGMLTTIKENAHAC